MRFDPRLTPARADVAAAHLRGQVEAARFVAGEKREVVDAQAPLRRAPSHDAPLDTEALRGERVTIYETTQEGWAWGQLETDGYVGWLPAGALGAPGAAPTHKVSALRTFVFPGASIKLPPLTALSLGCRLAVARVEREFVVLEHDPEKWVPVFGQDHAQIGGLTAGGFVPAVHLTALDTRETDFVAVAERFLGVPYLWGGKTSLGLDCSGLVQVSLAAAGIAAPRDSDLQERALGEDVSHDPAGWRRGDLVFWKGHVAIVRDRTTLLHANAHHMAVAIEPIAEALARIDAGGTQVSRVKRLI